MKSKLQIVCICIGALAAGAIGPGANAIDTNSGTSQSPATAPASKATIVEIDNFNFKPRDLTINAGGTVTWINHDDVPHTATGKGKTAIFDSKMLDTDEKFSFTFKNPGSYSYYCKVHPHMTATIVVK